MWKSAPETEAEVEKLEELERLERLFALSCYWKNAVFPEEYRADDAWLDLVVMAETADHLPEIDELRNRFPEPDRVLALFGTFYHHNVLIDWKRSNIAGIRALLERELLQEKIRLPYRFGRLLYDRFNNIDHSSRTDHLLAPDVRKLLEGTPQGVYHVGNFVSGPLGIIEVQETRWIPPTLSLPLWHCSDTGCEALHSVNLIPPTNPVVEAFGEINKLLQDRLGPASEWYPSLRRIHRRDRWPHGRKYDDLPVAIANCFVDSERRKGLAAAIASEHGKKLRETLASSPRNKEDSQGSPSQISERLPPTATLQLLWALDDHTLVALADSLIEKREIDILVGENRPVRVRPRGIGVTDSGTKVSAFGLRSTRVDPIVFMSAAIQRAYAKRGLANELEWRVRREISDTLEESVIQFIRQNGPREALEHLVLSSQAITEELCADSGVPFSNYLAAGRRNLDYLMWKLGFDPVQYDDSFERSKSRLTEFEQQVLEATPIDTEDRREKIRARGVNLFVSVEDFLERLIAFNVWLLAVDHFIDHRFSWSISNARQIVPSVLGQVLASGIVEHRWSTEGGNSLGVLLRYLSESNKWMMALAATDRSSLLRSDEDLSHYASDPDRPFVFRHLQLWADADVTQLRKYADGYREIVKLVEQSDLTQVRNGLDHYRDSQGFPEADKMLACATRLRKGLELADVNRYVPKIHWFHERVTDRFGFVESEFRDYANRRVVIRGPSTVLGLPALRTDEPIIIAGGNLLGHPNSTLTFRIREASEYSEYWDGYPRRRKIPADGTVLPDDRLTDAEAESDMDAS